MDYKRSAKEVIEYIGGKENIVSAAHCATRLRLVIADNDKMNTEAIENVDGVKGVFEAAGQIREGHGYAVLGVVEYGGIDIACFHGKTSILYVRGKRPRPASLCS